MGILQKLETDAANLNDKAIGFYQNYVNKTAITYRDVNNCG